MLLKIVALSSKVKLDQIVQIVRKRDNVYDFGKVAPPIRQLKEQLNKQLANQFEVNVLDEVLGISYEYQKSLAIETFDSGKYRLTHNLEAMLRLANAFEGRSAENEFKNSKDRFLGQLILAIHNIDNEKVVEQILLSAHKWGSIDRSDTKSIHVQKKAAELFNVEEALQYYRQYRQLLKDVQIYRLVRPDHNVRLAQALYQKYRNHPLLLEVLVNDKFSSINLTEKDSPDVAESIKEYPLITFLAKILNRELQLTSKVYAVGDTQVMENISFKKRFPEITEKLLKEMKNYYGVSYGRLEKIARQGNDEIVRSIKDYLEHYPDYANTFLHRKENEAHFHIAKPFVFNQNKLKDFTVISRVKSLESTAQKLLEKAGIIREHENVDWSDPKIQNHFQNLDFKKVFPLIRDTIGHSLVIPDDLIVTEDTYFKASMAEIVCFLFENILWGEFEIGREISVSKEEDVRDILKRERVHRAKIFLMERKSRLPSLKFEKDAMDDHKNESLKGKYLLVSPLKRADGKKFENVLIPVEIDKMLLHQLKSNEFDLGEKSHLFYKYKVPPLTADDIMVFVQDEKNPETLGVYPLKKNQTLIDLFVAINENTPFSEFTYKKTQPTFYRRKLENLKVIRNLGLKKWTEPLKNMEVVGVQSNTNMKLTKKIYEEAYTKLKKRQSEILAQRYKNIKPLRADERP